MKKFEKKLIVILGPTASGKSDLAVKIAKKFNGEDNLETAKYYVEVGNKYAKLKNYEKAFENYSESLKIRR